MEHESNTRVGEPLGVSTRALTIALQDAGIIDEQTGSNLSKVRVPAEQKVDPELANLGETAAARKRQLLERGLSGSYVALCFRAFDRGLVSGGRVAGRCFWSINCNWRTWLRSTASTCRQDE